MHSSSVAVLSGERKPSAIVLSLNVYHTLSSPARAWQCSLALSTSPVPLSLTEDMPSHAEEDARPGRPYRQNEAPALPQPSCHGAVHVRLVSRYKFGLFCSGISGLLPCVFQARFETFCLHLRVLGQELRVQSTCLLV